MFKLEINNTPVLSSKFFSATDAEAILEAIPADASRVAFVDTPSTPILAEVIKTLVEKGMEVVVRDHHRGEGRNPEAAEAVEAILGDNAKIVLRSEAPGCAQLIKVGEFEGEGTVIVADPDLDGLSTAMKAVGISYEGMDDDTSVFDVRPKQSAETLTPLGWTVVRAQATLPPYNPARPETSEQAKAELFGLFVLAAQGNEEARTSLEDRVSVYEASEKEAHRLLKEKMERPAPGVVLVDTRGAAQAELSTLTRGMEAAGGIVTGVRKDFGPIAGAPGGFGSQISLAVRKDRQADLDLRVLVPEGMETSPKAGLLSNTSFLLHCSEGVWERLILPGLIKLLG